MRWIVSFCGYMFRKSVRTRPPGNVSLVVLCLLTLIFRWESLCRFFSWYKLCCAYCIFNIRTQYCCRAWLYLPHTSWWTNTNKLTHVPDQFHPEIDKEKIGPICITSQVPLTKVFTVHEPEISIIDQAHKSLQIALETSRLSAKGKLAVSEMPSVIPIDLTCSGERVLGLPSGVSEEPCLLFTGEQLPAQLCTCLGTSENP